MLEVFMDTKENILNVALDLFSREGYEAVSVSMIASALGVTKGALYKHFENKQEIFDCLVDRMNSKRSELTNALTFPNNLFEELPEKYKNTGIDKLCAYTIAQYFYWTEDDSAAKFRRLLSLERYRNSKINDLYQHYFGDEPLEKAEAVMRELRRLGYTKSSPISLALAFYSPIYALISLYDGGTNKRVLAARLKEHLEAFVSGLDVPEAYVPRTTKQYNYSLKYNDFRYLSMLNGPNTLKLTEELLEGHLLRDNARVCDLNCGNGLTSLFMAKEYGFRVFATDPWSDIETSQKFFSANGLDKDRICAVKADAAKLPYNYGYFDAIISVNSYNYFGRNKSFLSNKLLPYVKPGGYIYIVIPGMVEDCHDNLPKELLLSWNPDQLESLHDVHYWRGIFSHARGADLLSIKQMEGKDEVWQDWICQDNPYAINDKKAMDAGAGQYLNFIKIVIRKR
jgi:AcrR family transcriptional regulator/SAM-dependent methyltransferase